MKQSSGWCKCAVRSKAVASFSLKGIPFAISRLSVQNAFKNPFEAFHKELEIWFEYLFPSNIYSNDCKYNATLFPDFICLQFTLVSRVQRISTLSVANLKDWTKGAA